MKVLLAADASACGALDGPGPWLDELTRRLLGRGHRVHVLLRDGPAPAAAGSTLPPASGELASVTHASTTEADGALQRLLCTAPDVVHLVGAGAWNDDSLRLLSQHAVLLDLWNFEACCPQHDLLQNPGGVACSEAWPSPACTHCSRPERIATMPGVQRTVAAATRIVARSAWARDRLSRTLGRTVERLACGIDTLCYRPQPAAARSPEVAVLACSPVQARVLFAGAPSEARGVTRLLDLLVALHARTPGIEMVVTGRDPANPNAAMHLTTEAKEMGLAEQLRMLPDVTPDDLPALIASCDVAIAPGTAPDAHGLAVLQAMACAKAVVAHPAGAILELITHGEEGLLLPATDLPAFATAVSVLLRDHARRHAMGQAARLTAIERHDLEPALFALEETYHRLRVLKPAMPAATVAPAREAA